MQPLVGCLSFSAPLVLSLCPHRKYIRFARAALSHPRILSELRMKNTERTFPFLLSSHLPTVSPLTLVLSLRV
jgi:hypothetical protein